MSADTATTAASPIAGRAGIALLTLQLRAAQQEAAQAEAAALAAEQGTAREQLRARIDPMLAARTSALETALADAREEASASIAAAHREADTIVAAAGQRSLATPLPASGTALVPTHNPGFDAEAFATVFATVFASKMDERLGAWTPPAARQPGVAAPQPKRSFNT